MRKVLTILGFATLLFGPAFAATAPSPVPITMPKSYDDCVSAISKKADDALERALYWSDHNGGVPAQHCAALALIALNAYQDAATRLEAIARDPDAGTLMERAEFLDQAGNAWILDGRLDTAEQTFSAALKLSPRNATLWLDRGRVKAAKKQWAAAEDDIDHALVFDAKRTDAYVARAAARAQQGKKDQARADIDKALAINPVYPDALVERGHMRWEAGDKKGARGDWRDALVNAPADSVAAETARNYIQNAEIPADK